MFTSFSGARRVEDRLLQLLTWFSRYIVLTLQAVWECAGRVYLAMELCDYTLDEYVGIVRLDHRQDPLSANRLAWQLLKGLKYLHSNFTVPHGSLMVRSFSASLNFS